MTYRHKVESGRDVIVGGMVYKPDRDGIVLLPEIVENADIVPIDRPLSVEHKTPKNKVGNAGDNETGNDPATNEGDE